ncbi:protoporphyrinogen oxidase [Rhodosalinus sediminis]|uniref:Protoporphyrinogen oxidase n=1 Tax=Rhodosalinus sediminis TaxID=1940533 RepID=A0A3D9BQI9_9RHOB|nr:flavodoxin domain-containing protein [Rhodosalinus sediminis]REC55788.1 protoporphyrinogen oxidase [Rhodosalinus sediminis]
MAILVVYATTEGQTRRVARFVAHRLAGRGHGVELLAVADAEEIDWTSVEAAVLAGSVHMGRVQADLAAFAADHAAALNARPTLFLQVSLCAAGTDPEELAEIDRIARAFCAEAGWRPGRIVQVAGAFRFTQYDFFRRWAMRHIAAQKGETVDPGQDREYTDWAALGALCDGWAEELGEVSARSRT